MLRTMVIALALGAPSLAVAEQFPQSAMDVAVRADDGSVIGRVEAVERNAEGDIVAVEIPGLEPGDAPHAPNNLIADDRRELLAPAAAEQPARVAANDRRIMR
jgi:hypothetical protein